MTEHSEKRLVPLDADLMFSVVADVERYPEFLPWCLGLRVLSRKKDGEKEILSAEMVVGYHSFRERYTSTVVLDPTARRIDVTQAEGGPFRLLENHWHFTPKDEACEVDFRIAFAFKNRLLNMVAGAAFERVQMKLADAFEARAKALSSKG
jgi:coenzyme Q-binding protein COQ10